MSELPRSPGAERSTDGSVAIVHDYLNQPGGAERVVLEMARIWPEARLYTSLYRPASTHPEFRTLPVTTSPVDRIPTDGRFRLLAPLLPAAFRAFGELGQDLVISSSSGWAHAVRTSPASLHVVYCYTPARWLYRPDEYMRGSLLQRALPPFAGALRRWDRAAAARPDAYIAISNEVRKRIRAAYGRDAVVVHPPVDVQRFTPSERGDRLLVVSRLLPYKRIDLAVRAATAAGLPLDVVGTGPALESLRALAGPTVQFHGRLADEDVTALIGSASAIVLPGHEDFGIVPIEANAAGKPVVAFAGGGALETIVEGVGGAFFHEPTPESLIGAVRRLDHLEGTPMDRARLAARFSRERFAAALAEAVDRLRERRPVAAGQEAPLAWV